MMVIKIVKSSPFGSKPPELSTLLPVQYPDVKFPSKSTTPGWLHNIVSLPH